MNNDNYLPSKKKRAAIVTSIAVGGVILALILTVLVYVIYVLAGFSRIEDGMQLEISGEATKTLSTGGEYTVMTYNVGFGAYSPEYTFFMDTGEMKDGTKTQGRYGKAIDKADVEKNIEGSAALVKKYSPDFAILQEVDYDSTRSYKVDQREAFMFDEYESVFACNYHSGYLFYPLSDPHGKSNAGIMTLSKYKTSDSMRYSFPIADDLSKLTDLDRCYSVTHVPVGDKYLALISLHMSAYDEGGTIRKKQAEKLRLELEKEYKAGNYVIAGGDFNQDLIENLEKFESEQKVPPWIASCDKADVPQGFSIYADKDSTVGSCRGADVIWERGKTYTCVIDGFIVSDNIDVKSVEIIDNDFAFSDHNPVVMRFVIKN